MDNKENVAPSLGAAARGDIFLRRISNPSSPTIEDLERVVAELEEFAQATPWISLQAQPESKQIDHGCQ